MYGDLTLQQSQFVQANTTANLRKEAAQHFWQAQLGGLIRQGLARLTGRPTHPADLNERAAEITITNRRYIGIQSVDLHDIVGSEGRSQDFDAHFRPVASHNRDRWIGILTAMFQGVSLPPVSLVKLGDEYYIRDGNHRVSVSRFLDLSQIDAEVTVWQTA